MTDEEKKDVTDETPKDEAAEAAGPVAEGDPSSSQAAGDVPPSTPPAEEAPEAEATDESAEDSAPVPEAEQAEPDPEDDLPWKERRRLERSRQPHKAGAALSPEERASKRAGGRKLKAESRRKERAAAKQGKTAVGTGTPPAEKDAVAAKTRQGLVVSNKGEKTITVRIDIARRHPTYEKVVRRSRTLHAHDERNEAGEGDTVRIVETRPLSKTKRWRLVEVLEKAK
jgi:small subunit ribosomal protein S17